MARPRRTPAELARDAIVTPADIDRARALWKASAPAGLRNLLDAREPGTAPARKPAKPATPAGPRRS